jgi:dTDP-4-dehydrorhamnose reductase
MTSLIIVGNQISCATYAQDIAKSIVSILYCLDLKGSSSDIYDYGGNDSCSWYDFSRYFFRSGIVWFKNT